MSVNETDDLTELRLWLVRLVSGSIALGLLVVLPYLWWLNVTPIDQREAILGVKDSFELRNQAIKSVTTSIQILATVFGGIAILFNVYYGAKRAKALEKNAIAATQNAIAATKNAEVAEQGQITERFTKAIEQLGSDNISIRLGGIYALESIAEYSQKGHWSERSHWTIMEVLSAFVRENPSLKEDLEAKKAEGEQQPQKLRTDIQSALTVIGRRDLKKDPSDQMLNLSNTNLKMAVLTEAEANLQGLNLFGANLQEAKLFKAKLQGANLSQAKLQDAVFSAAKLQGANLRGANLERAFLCQAKLPDTDLREANLERTNFGGANLERANFGRANLERANLRGAILQEAVFSEAKLQGADFENANLQYAKLLEADLQGANLNGVNVQGADFRGAKNLTLEQVKLAHGDSKTMLSENIERPAHWM